MDLEKMFSQYLETALWSSLDDSGGPLDGVQYSKLTWDPLGLINSKQECRIFLVAAEIAGLINDESDFEQIGHDFWLTRNGHGAGFWDSPEKWGGEINADKLSELSIVFGESNVDADLDDGLFYIS